MKITIVQGAFLPVPPLRGGAVEKVWFALGKEFARLGHDVTHISRSFPDLPAEQTIGGVRHIRVRGFDVRRSVAVLKLCDLLYSFRVLRVLPRADVLVTNVFWLPILVRSTQFGKLYVHIARYPRGQTALYSHAARLQTVSTHIREAIVREIPRLADKTITIPNPLPDTSRDGDVEIDAGRTREPWLLYVGRVHPEKGIGLLIDAAKILAGNTSIPWKLVIVGPSDADSGGGGMRYAASLRKQADLLLGRVEWVGAVFDPAQLADYYRRASLFIYPSLAELGEACPLAPLEAMSHGCPPLVSGLVCFRDYLDDAVNGFVFDHRGSNAAAALAAKIAELIQDPVRLASAGVSARATSRQYALDRIAVRYLEDFESLCTATSGACHKISPPCPSN